MRQCRGVPIKKILLEGGEEYEVRIFLKDFFERLTRVTDDVHSYNSLVFLMYCSFFVPFLWQVHPDFVHPDYQPFKATNGTVHPVYGTYMNSLSNLEGVSTGPMTWTMFGRAFHVVSCLLYQLKESKMFDHVVKLPPPPLPRMFVGLFSFFFFCSFTLSSR